MQYLRRGSLRGREDFFDALIDLSKFRSPSTIKWLHKYFVDGYTVEGLVTLLGADKGNLYRDIKKLQQLSHRYEKLKEIDLQRYHLVLKK